MNIPHEIDLVSVGIIAAYDKDTGEVLHVHETIVEVTNGEYHCGDHITEQECEDIKRQIAEKCKDRNIEIVDGPPELGMAQDRPVRYRVDLKNRSVSVEPVEDSD